MALSASVAPLAALLTLFDICALAVSPEALLSAYSRLLAGALFPIQGGFPLQAFQLAWVAVAQPVCIVVEIASWNSYG